MYSHAISYSYRSNILTLTKAVHKESSLLQNQWSYSYKNYSLSLIVVCQGNTRSFSNNKVRNLSIGQVFQHCIQLFVRWDLISTTLLPRAPSCSAVLASCFRTAALQHHWQASNSWLVSEYRDNHLSSATPHPLWICTAAASLNYWLGLQI